MMRNWIVLAGLALVMVGCGDSGPEGTAQDKANLDRLSKEGMSPPPAGGGSAPAPKVNEKGGIPGNPQPSGAVPPP